MKFPTKIWAATTVMVWFATGVAMVLLEMEPRLLLVGLVMLLLAAAAWLLSSLAEVSTPLSWYDHGSTANSSARPDRRVQLLTARLRHNNRRKPIRLSGAGAQELPDQADEIVEALNAVIAEHLVATRGIDPTTDPAGTTSALGPELTRFISDPVTARSMTQRQSLAHTISLIEEFTSSQDDT